MPKKLVLDRALSLCLRDGTFTDVPKDEVWKVISTKPLRLGFGINGTSTPDDQVFLDRETSFLLGPNVRVEPGDSNRNSVAITGLAFKLQEV